MTSTESVRPLRFGIIGCGALGVVHARRLAELPGVHVCAVSDPNPDAMRQTAEVVPADSRGGQPEVAAYADYRDLLRRGDLDAVSINSPNKWHVEQLLASLESGLHVMCEKPLSMVPEEVTQVVEATQKSGKIVAITYQSRYRTEARILKRALQSGQWGRVTAINVFSSEDWITPNVGTWRHDPARCPGGHFADANGHQLDLLFWLTGLEAEWVRATTDGCGTPVPIRTWGEASLKPQLAGESAPNVPMTFLFSGDARSWREEIALETERADFVLRNTRLLWTDGKQPLGPYPESEIDPVDLTLPDLPDTGFVTALRGGAPIVTPPETVWPVLRFTRAGLVSAENGSVLTPAV